MSALLSNAQPSVLVEVFLKFREERSKLAEREANLKAKQDLVASAILAKMAEHGTDGFTTMGFTAYKSELTTTQVHDRVEFFDYVMATGKVELLEARCSKDAIAGVNAQLAADYQKVIDTYGPESSEAQEAVTQVPGVTVNRTVRVNVRKAK